MKSRGRKSTRAEPRTTSGSANAQPLALRSYDEAGTARPEPGQLEPGQLEPGQLEPGQLEPGRLGTVVGYTVVRALGVGSRSTVYLGRAAREAVGATSTVAIKVIGAGTSDESVDDEVRALAAHGSQHVVRLLDISTVTPGRRCLVFERLSGSLDELLERRGRIRPGEAVTILASVARGLRELQEAGWAHGGLSPGSVLFDHSGRPVIIGLGRVSRLNPERRNLNEAARDDWQRFRRLAERVLQCVELEGREGTAVALLDSIDAVAEPGASVAAIAAIEEAVFAIGPPAPVVLARSAPTASTVTGGSLERDFERLVGEAKPAKGAAGRWPLRAEPALADRASVPIHPSARRERVGVLAAELMDRGVTGPLRDRLRAVIAARRRQLVFAGVAGAAVLVLSLTLIPTGEAEPQAATRSARPTAPLGTAGVPSSARAPEARSSTEAATSADDPVLATERLIVERQRCLDQASLACLENVDQPGSALLETDRSAVAKAHDRDETDHRTAAGGYTVSLIERTGNSALLDLVPPAAAPPDTKPASALVIKGEAGWRLREIFAS